MSLRGVLTTWQSQDT